MRRCGGPVSIPVHHEVARIFRFSGRIEREENLQASRGMRMRREFVLTMVVALGVLSMAVSAQRGGAPQGPNVVEIDKISDRLFVGKGGGGNTAIFLTANGTVLVDTKLPGWGQPLLDAVKKVSNRPITMIVNTHSHGDHTSGQLEMPGSIEVVAHENTRTNMLKLEEFKKDQRMLPKRTFKDRLTLGRSEERRVGKE